MIKSLRSKILLGLLALAVTLPAASQLIYGNTFPFWNVNGPLTVTGVSTHSGGMVISGGAVISGSPTSIVAPTITGTVTAAGINGTLITGTVVTGSTQVTTPLLTTSGYLQFPTIHTVTGDTTVGATDSWIIANKAGTVALTLPDATAAAQIGRLICVKTSQAQTVTSATSNVVPLITAAAGTAILAGTAGKWACMVSDGTNWVIMAAN